MLFTYGWEVVVVAYTEWFSCEVRIYSTYVEILHKNVPIECAFLFTFRGNLSNSELTEWNCITKLMGVSYIYKNVCNYLQLSISITKATLRLKFLQSRTDCIFLDRIVGYELPKCQTFSQLPKKNRMSVWVRKYFVHQIHIVSQYIDRRQ